MKRILAWLTRLFTKPTPIVEPIPTPLPVQPAIAYPRIAAYAWMRGNGSPLAFNGVISPEAIRDYARYDVLTLEPARYGIGAEAQRALSQELRKRRGTTLLAFVPTCKFFVCGPGWFFGPPIPGCDTEQLAYKRAEVVRDHDALLYGMGGKPYLGGGWIDFTKPGLPEALADLVAEWVTAPGIFDGIFCDESPLGITWSQSFGDVIDYRRSGFSSLDAWAASYRACMTSYFQWLRFRLGSKVIVGNGGQFGPRLVNGWMRENFPYQNGAPATWETNMLGWPGVAGDVGYLGDGAAYAQPSLCWLTAWGAYPDTAMDERRARLTLASATLGDGVGCMTWSPNDPSRGKHYWMDEYSVRPDGTPDPTGAHRGWLGTPVGPAFLLTDTVWMRQFSRGCVLVNPTSTPATVRVNQFYKRLFIAGPLDEALAGPDNTDHTVPAMDGLFLQRRP